MYIFSMLLDKIFSLIGNADNIKYHIMNNFQRKFISKTPFIGELCSEVKCMGTFVNGTTPDVNKNYVKNKCSQGS